MDEIDIGLDHFITYFSWRPDDFPENRKRFGYPLPNVTKVGLFIRHPNKNGQYCHSAMYFEGTEYTKHYKTTTWKVEKWEPLTITPSIKCLTCQDHGFITDGKWVPA